MGTRNKFAWPNLVSVTVYLSLSLSKTEDMEAWKAYRSAPQEDPYNYKTVKTSEVH